MLYKKFNLFRVQKRYFKNKPNTQDIRHFPSKFRSFLIYKYTAIVRMKHISDIIVTKN